MDLSLPITSYIVLGLLSFGQPLSGYQIRKRGQNLKYFYWSPAQSQIYRELRRLQESELVESWHVEQEGKPNKQMFQINEAGTAVFKHWLANATLPPTVIKHPMLLKLFFGQMADNETLIKLLNEFIDNTKDNLGQLAIVQEYMKIDDEMAHSALVIEWSLHYYQSELEIANKLLTRLVSEAG